ncbi:AAA family ATPase [Elizabethkingia miricola]|uniref:McrB family protein n=1 Tax=Elizabethkingia miricola TaxID=172045 RepID=UPI002012407B|nr:AAA family ATPase [Elizabethkingia miricola]MCL1679291.1 AAA family ATPase [Elizabethkingia miricola]
MTENLKNITYHLIEKYIDILEENGEPNEAYKYLAINTFKQNWDLEAEDFYQMFRSSFSKVSNLLYQNSWGFIEKSTHLFPNEVREMFRNLYDESVEISQRIKTFQTESEKILPKVRQSLNRTNINTQQDERTISVYLAFRFPEKYMLYKADYYKNFCEQLNIKAKKSGERFLHLQELANQIIQENRLNDNNFINTYRKFYQKPNWNDKYLMIQNVLYVVFRDAKDFNLLELFNKFDKKQLEEYYDFLDSIIENFGFQEDDKRLVFNADKNKIVFTIGQRYIWNTATIGKDDYKFRTISEQQISNNFVNFDGSPTAYLCKINNISEAHKNKQSIFNSIENELNRTQISSYSKYNKKELEKMAFDIDFRNEILSQLEYQTTTEKQMENINSDKKIPLNQILFGAPGTGKTYTLKNEYFPKYTISEKSITPESYFEEIVSGLTWWQTIALALLEVGTSKVNDILENRWVSKKAVLSESKNVRATIWGNLQFHTIIESKTVNYTQRQTPYIFDKTKDKKWELLENELKEQAPEIYDILDSVNNFKPNPNKEIKHYVFTTFHQSFSYEDFIEGIKPVMEEGKETISYQIENGIFKDLCLKAQNDTENRYAIFIDEINRGNVSAIFGELITLIEPDKRIGAVNELKVKLPYSKREFGVPKNVDIIGTMNTADRSVEALDTALRRRFSFVEMQPNPSVLLNSEYQDVDLKQLLEMINQRIEVFVDKDHQIGHSYFIGIQNLEDLKQTFKDKIIPLLEEYFYGDFGKIGLVLGGSFIYQEENKAKFPKNFSYENDFLEDKKVYRFTPFENWDEQTFISVYED